MTWQLRASALIGLLCAASALYGPSSAVLQLDEKDFRKQVLRSDEVWMVEFYAPWCGHCKNLAPEWEKAAKVLKGVVKVAAVDATQHEGLAAQYGVQGFPTIKIFGEDKSKPTDYQGARSADAIAQAGLNAVQATVRARQSGKSKSSSSSSSSSRRSKSDVIQLDESNFREQVLDSDDIWFVEFYAPWCGHCKKLAPEWEQAATSLKGEVKVGAVDATAYQSLAAQYQVQGYPTIKVFLPGKKNRPLDYQGAREADSITAYGLELAASHGPPPTIHQLVDQSVFDKTCGAAGQVCVITFLPHLLDTGKDGRNEYLKQLQAVAQSVKGKRFVFLWSEGTAQGDLEAALELNFGYPALVALSTEKKVFSTFRGTFSELAVREYLFDLSRGGGNKAPLPDLPRVQTVTPWDGEDAPVLEEEFSLEDLMD